MTIFFRTLLIFLFSLWLVAAASAQDRKVRVEGRIVNGETGSPVEFATVSFLSPGDSALVTGDVTDEAGRFSLGVAPGSYLMKVQFISYKTLVRTIRVGEEATRKNLGKIGFYEDVAQLSEVVVQGQRTQAITKLDKRVYNVGQDLVNRSGDAAQVLDNLPSVSVDVDGNVSLRGSQSVKILIDGKPSSLAGIDGASALQQLDGSMVERVEVITNPSARYEAQGMAGIINIVLKKERRQGINGTVSAETGYPDDHGASFNLNYRQKGLNIFGGYSLNYRNSPREGSSFRRFFNEDTVYTTDITNDMRRKDFSNSFRLGADLYIGEKNVITASGIYRFSDEQSISDIHYFDRDSNGDLVSTVNRLNDEVEDESALEYNINYVRTFSNQEHKLTIDLQFQDNRETEDSDIRETVMYGGGPLLQQYLNKEKEEEYLLQADYIYPFGENNRFEAGWRSSIRTINNRYRVEERSEGEWTPLPRFTNDFFYDEDNHALYAIYGRTLNELSFQAGFRAEYTRVKTLLRQTSENSSDSYLHVFPSLHVNYDLKNDHSLQVSYSKRYNRPHFRMLNPFHSYSDARNISSGNPALKPEFTDSYELGYLKNWSHGTLYFGAYYRYTTDEFERVETSIGDTIYSRPVNLSVEDAIGLEANVSNALFDFLNIDANLNFYSAKSQGQFSPEQGGPINLYSETLTMSGRINLQASLSDDVNLQLNSFYRAPRNTTQGKQESLYAADLGISKDFFSGKGTLVFNIRNILNSMKFRSETFGENFYSHSEYTWRPRQFTLSFLYRINANNGEQRRSNGEQNGEFNEAPEF